MDSSNFGQSLIDGLSNWWDDWWQQVQMNVLWLVSALTIVLGPPATFALYNQNKLLAEDRRTAPGAMLKSYKQFFGISWLWVLSNVFVFGLLAFAFRFYGTSNTRLGVTFMVVVAAVALIWAILQIYVVPVLMWQDERSLRLALRNSFALAIRFPFSTLFTVILVGIIWSLSLVSGILLIFGGVALGVALNCHVVYGHLLETQPRNDA